MMKLYNLFLFIIAFLMVVLSSCGDKNNEPDAAYKYYMRIQSQVALDLSDNAEENGTLVETI